MVQAAVRAVNNQTIEAGEDRDFSSTYSVSVSRYPKSHLDGNFDVRMNGTQISKWTVSQFTNVI